MGLWVPHTTRTHKSKSRSHLAFTLDFWWPNSSQNYILVVCQSGGKRRVENNASKCHVFVVRFFGTILFTMARGNFREENGCEERELFLHFVSNEFMAFRFESKVEHRTFSFGLFLWKFGIGRVSTKEFEARRSHFR